jgi:type III pantothenate kinase
MTTLVIDAGNTSIKAAVFTDGIISSIYRFDLSNFSEINQIVEFPLIERTAISSVLNEKDTSLIAAACPSPKNITTQLKTNLKSKYESMNTLGMDRWANANAGNHLSNNGKCVTVDIGTCIKFDVVIDHVYMGGSISPGIDLRYKSLNDYTAALPLLNKKEECPLNGNSTALSIQSGVINGIQAEINDLIRRYEDRFECLTFFVTGGDAQYFDFGGKNNIFVDENLTLKGIYQIFKLNA